MADDTKEPKGSILEEEIKDIEELKYTPEEEDYIKNLRKRLDSAKELRDQSYDEFDGMSLVQYWQTNENLANTMLSSVKNKGDVDYKSGTLRTKMFALLNSIQGLNLSPQIEAFDSNDIPIQTLGNVMEDIIDKTEELEGDDEKRALRQYELMKHGTIFVEELWEQKWEVNKTITKGFLGKVKDAIWKTKRKLGIGMPKRNIVPLLNVYLGDLRIYNIEEQPYIFTVQTINYDEAKQLYGDWERWSFVERDKKSFISGVGDESNTGEGIWRFSDDQTKDKVEVIKYQDKPNNEFQILLNGIPMLPAGYPLPWGHEEYSIIQQNFEPIRHNFAYGKSFIFDNKNLVILLDEMMKLAVLKTQKSFMPPYLNTSGRLVTKRVFMPGNIARGIEAGSLVPVSEKETQGVTTSEFAMIQEIMQNINTNTTSQTFGGQKEGGQVTATQIVELQRQAKIMMAYVVLACSLLEQKLASKRLLILLEKWFDPINTKLDEARNKIKDIYRITSRAKMTDRGMGVRMTVLSEDMPDSKQIMEKEEVLEKKFGKPFEIVVLKPSEIKTAKTIWNVTVHPKEKKSSELSKLLFEAMIGSAINLGLVPNRKRLETSFVEVWETDPKLFEQEEGMPAQGIEQPQQPGDQGFTPQTKTPSINVKAEGNKLI